MNGLAPRGPSHSALTAAAARAAHLIVDKEPFVFADTLAAALLGERAEELISYHRLHGGHPVLAGARAQVTCRSRYAEDCLAAAAQRGVTQYVILGAGLDTYAYRAPLTAPPRVLEVDHPATQQWKRAALAAAGIAVPGGVTFAAADLAGLAPGQGEAGLAAALRGAGLDPAAPAFVSWLGVTMYLSPGDVAATLAGLAALAPGTEVVADYLLAPGLRDEAGATYAELVGAASAERGEPWLSSFAPADLTALAAGAGYGQVRHVRQGDILAGALGERADCLAPSDLAVVFHGRVAAADAGVVTP